MRFFNDGFDPVEEFVSQWNQHVRHLRRTCLIVSAGMLVIGILCIFFPKGIFLTLQGFSAIALLIYGIYHFLTYLYMPGFFRDPFILLLSLFSMIAGILLFDLPLLLTMTTVAFFLGMLLLLVGAEKLSRAKRLRYYHLMNTVPIMISGMMNMFLGVLFLFLPVFSVITLHYLIAAYLIISSISLFIEALSMRILHR